MGLHRPKAIDDPCHGPRTDYPCWTWRWRTGMLLMVAAALTAVMPTAGAATHAWGHLGRPWPTAAAGAIGFAASPSSATVRCPFSRRNQYHLRLSAASGGGSAYGSSSGGSPHRHSSRTCLRPPAISFWGQLHDQHRCQTHQHYGCQVTAQPLPVGYGGRASPLSARAGVGVGMNVSSSTEILQSVEGEETTVTLTEAGGRPHTATSRARISAANKGKEPWNKGGRHSEETRRKIAEGARNAARKRREATALSLGMTLEEYDDMKQRRKPSEKNPEVTMETRLKISARLKEKWKDPIYRERRKGCMPNRQGVAHSEETKARIAAAVKARWQDPAYREKITSRVASEETRAKIGKIIKDQWADPEIRQVRMAKMMPKTEEHKKRISEGVRNRWADPEFRKQTSEKMRAAAHARIIATGGVPKPRRERRPRTPRAPGTGSAKSRGGPDVSRMAARNMAKWARMGRAVEAKMEREVRRESKRAAAAAKLAAKEAKLEAERLAQEEEDKLVEGLDELEMVLMRQTLRAKKQHRIARAAKEAAKVAEEERAAREPIREPEQEVPEGFEMVEMNGRMVLRMK
eukprot:jgi/Undpi1/5833/HiC_scaffold_2.g01107.m1